MKKRQDNDKLTKSEGAMPQQQRKEQTKSVNVIQIIAPNIHI
jgi:hypothetical protein